VVTACLGGVRRVEARVGISFVSTEQAQRALASEVGNRGFDAVAAGTAAEWELLLGRFRVEGGSDRDRLLWTTMWQRLHAMPGELQPDEVPWMAPKYRHFNDIYCLWDSVRCANSLYALVDAPFASDLCASLVEIGEQTGWIPDAWMTGGSAYIQGDCSAAVLFAEAALKRLPGFDADGALRALLKTLEAPSPDPLSHGRHPGWAKDGFIALGIRNCASRTVEYAFHDHCASLLAETIGDGETATRYRLQAARLWENWHPGHRCFGPRRPDGSWDDFDPWKPQCRDFWNDPHFYEGTGHDYALTSWHVMGELVKRHGGAGEFAAYLDEYLKRCYFWKEINLHAPWLYHYAGMPERVAPALHKLMDRKVKPGRAGLADNEDMGAWSSWWITGAMGLCPVPGSDHYLLAAPRFDRIEIDLVGIFRPLTFTVRGDSQKPLRGISLNGNQLHRFWVSHAEIAAGADIGFHF
jgi:predicted alpha-1,2-mannosidase